MDEISPTDFLKLYNARVFENRSAPLAVDVRSPGEFALGHLPLTANEPILTDSERHEVGWTYKNKGQDAAIQIGYSLVQPHRSERVIKWREALEPANEKIIFCWRGGLRSKITQTWLQEAGFSVRRIFGGYKAVRTSLLNELECPPDFVILGGMTGSGKTRLLKSLSQGIDLEGLAHHRGSAFGLDIGVQQPAQSTFENALAVQFLITRGLSLIEDESRQIGKIRLPNTMYEKMASAPMICIESSIRDRASEIFSDYVVGQSSRANDFSVLETHFQNCLKKIERKIGGLRFQECSKLLKAAFSITGEKGWNEESRELHLLWIEFLLREYYDQMYQFAMARKPRKIIHRGSWQECLHFAKNLEQGSIYESQRSKF